MGSWVYIKRQYSLICCCGSPFVWGHSPMYLKMCPRRLSRGHFILTGLQSPAVPLTHSRKASFASLSCICDVSISIPLTPTVKTLNKHHRGSAQLLVDLQKLQTSLLPSRVHADHFMLSEDILQNSWIPLGSFLHSVQTLFLLQPCPLWKTAVVERRLRSRHT